MEEQKAVAPAEPKAKGKKAPKSEAASAVEAAPAVEPTPAPETPVAPAEPKAVVVMKTRVKYQGRHWEMGEVVKDETAAEHFLLHGLAGEQVGG
jgi:hypothetical protein